MPALDLFHEKVRNTLKNDNWTITDESFALYFDEDPLYIDFAAEKMIAAQKYNRKIAVEVKSFVGGSFIYEFHGAVGQYLNYKIGLEVAHPERILYLAVPGRVYERHFGRRLVQSSIERHDMKLWYGRRPSNCLGGKGANVNNKQVGGL